MSAQLLLLLLPGLPPATCVPLNIISSHPHNHKSKYSLFSFALVMHLYLFSIGLGYSSGHSVISTVLPVPYNAVNPKGSLVLDLHRILPFRTE